MVRKVKITTKDIHERIMQSLDALAGHGSTLFQSKGSQGSWLDKDRAAGHQRRSCGGSIIAEFFLYGSKPFQGRRLPLSHRYLLRDFDLSHKSRILK
jgi:hypothetical protein